MAPRGGRDALWRTEHSGCTWGMRAAWKLICSASDEMA